VSQEVAFVDVNEELRQLAVESRFRNEMRRTTVFRYQQCTLESGQTPRMHLTREAVYLKQRGAFTIANAI